MGAMGLAGGTHLFDEGKGRLATDGVLLAVSAVLILAAIYEAAIAAGLIGLGPDPGEAPTGNDVVILASLAALLIGGIALFAAGLTTRPVAWVVQLTDLAAVAFVVARWLSYDPYYAPSLRRMSDGGLIPAWWIIGLIGLGALAAWMVRRSAPAGSLLGGLLLWTAALTALLSPAGH